MSDTNAHALETLAIHAGEGPDAETGALRTPLHLAASYQLPGFIAGGSKSKAANHVVNPAFQHNQQVFAGNTFGSGSLFKIEPELLFQHTIDTAYFLFFTQLHTVVRQTTTTGAMLAGGRFEFTLAI